MRLGRRTLGLRYVPEKLPMSMVTRFPRPALKRQALVAVVLFALAICLVWAGISWAWAIEGHRPFPTIWQSVLVGALVLGFMLWKTSRRPRTEVLAWIRLRILFRRRRWVALFGFPIFLMLFGIGLGACCALSLYFDDASGQVAQYASTYMALGGLLGFCGGFALHLPGAGGNEFAGR